MNTTPSRASRRWRCGICGVEYHEGDGMPDLGIAAGTPWEKLPDDYTCPNCGVNKAALELLA